MSIAPYRTGALVAALLVLQVGGGAHAQSALDAPTLPPAVSEVTPIHAVLADMLGGTPQARHLGITVQGGWPWSLLRAHLGLGYRLALIADVETALGRRFRPTVGLGVRLATHHRVRLSGELLLGWLVQTGVTGRRGPTGELRLRLALLLGRAVPYLVLGTRHTLLADRTVFERAAGSETSWSFRQEWTPWATLGLGIAVTRNFGFDVGADYGWVDAPQTIALPGVHLGLHFGPRGGL